MTLDDIAKAMGGSDHKDFKKIKESLKFIPPHVLLTMDCQDVANFVHNIQCALHEKWRSGYKSGEIL